jgi:hypothetical protein
MNRKVLAIALGGVALGAMALPAYAQTSKPLGLSIRAGVVFPTTNGSNTVLFGGGLEYALSNSSTGNMGLGSNGHLSISADYYGKNGAYAIPIMVNYVGTANEFYYTIGAGITDSNDSVNSSWNFGYTAAVGINFSQSQTPFFLEGRFWGNSDSRFNAIGAYLGVRL